MQTESGFRNKLPYIQLNLGGHCFFSDLGQEVEVGYWAVVFESVFVKYRFFKTFTEGKIYYFGDLSEEDIEAFVYDKSRTGILVT